MDAKLDKQAVPVVMAAFAAIRPDATEETIANYTEKALPLLVAAGAVPLDRFQIKSRIAGETPVHVMFMAEFPDAQSIESVFESDEYKALLPARSKAFEKMDIFITERI